MAITDRAGEALLDADEDRIGEVSALGLDEVLMMRVGPYRRQAFSTQMVDVRRGQLLDIVPGRGSAHPMGWLAAQGADFRARIAYGTLDLSGPYRRVFEVMVPTATWSPIRFTSPRCAMRSASPRVVGFE